VRCHLAGDPKRSKHAPNRLPIGCPGGAFRYFRVAIRAVKSATYASARPLITQRSQVQILPPQPIPTKLRHSQTPLSSSDSRLAHLWPTGFLPQQPPISKLADTYFQRFCGYFCQVEHCRLEDKRLPTLENKRLSFPVTLVTVLVRRTVTSDVLFCQPFSLRKLCVALCAQGALKNENPSGFSCRLRSVLPLRVYAVCHAQSCERSRASRPGRRTISVSSALWCPQGTGPVAGQASQEVAPSQGASAWGRPAH
jgi:hypothetical protein